MRFGKRTKNPLSWGRRGANAVDGQAGKPVHEQEPEAPVAREPERPAPPAAEPQDQPQAHDRAVTSDPTQRLLTSLGRFQRQFMKARDGAPQEQWSDECMNHLIHGVEIALEQEWGDIVDALTETGRILQTYEDAGRANECVPFLADSYEILCLMVGDLIVDKVRTGVIRKWRDRYHLALEELATEGLTLIEDDEPASRSAPAADETTPASGISPNLTLMSGLEEESKIQEESSAGDSAALGELPPLIEIEAPSRPQAVARSPFIEGTSQEAPFAEAFIDQDSREPGGVDAPDMLSEAATGPGSDGLLEDVRPQDHEPPELPERVRGPEAAQGLDRNLVHILDALCDGLARMESEPEIGLSTVLLAMDDGLSSLEDRANQAGWAGSVLACRTMKRLCAAAADRKGPLGDRFFEIAYAFGGVFGDAKEQQDAPLLTNWIGESENLLAVWRGEGEEAPMPVQGPKSGFDDDSPFELPPSEPASTDELAPEFPVFEEAPWDVVPPEPAAPVEAPGEPRIDMSISNGPGPEGEALEQPASGLTGSQEPQPPALVPPEAPTYVEISSAEPARTREEAEADPASHLLDTARQAVASGSSADAKLFAMQAAASIARAQAKEAEARVRQAEIRLQETAKSIEIARQQVQEAEGQVTEAEAHVGEGKEALAERGRHTHGVMGSLEGVRSRISDLDRRIQELQAQRDDAVRQRAAAETALEEARQQESNVKAHLDTLKNAEQMARVRLEDARGQVKLLQRKQAEIESIMERARDSLTRYRESMADIEKTVELIRSAETGVDGEGDELLF